MGICVKPTSRSLSSRNLAALAVLAFAIVAHAPAGATPGQLKIHLINVSKGDATFIEFPDGTTWLIDQGYTNTDGTNVHDYIAGLGFSNGVTYIAASHFHSDHIGGVDTVLVPPFTYVYGLQHAGPQSEGDSGFTTTWRSLVTGARAPSRGETWNLGGVEVQSVCVGDTDSGWNELFDGTHVSLGSGDDNPYSLGFRISWSGFDYFTAGDSYSNVENILAPKIASHNFDVVKLSHHGSASSTSLSYCQTMHPTVAVASVGSSDPEEHPHPTTLANLRDPSWGGVSHIYVTAAGPDSPPASGNLTYCENTILITYTYATNNYTVAYGTHSDSYTADEGPEATPTSTPTGPTPTPTRTATPTQTPYSFPVMINFQPGDSEVPSGYFPDDGSPYGVQGPYGW
jgi:beta-lactamase superfamily II metal-dependent hydrolase